MKHTFRKCLSIVLALATLLSVCVVPLTAATPACDHYAHEETWSYIGYQDPTCTEYGGHAYLCGECKTRFIDHRTWKEPLNHKNADGTSALKEIDRKEATLEKDGWVKYVCNLCGKNVEQTLSATKCKECKYEYTSTATCTEAGIKTGVCKVCGHKTEEAAPALGHDWDNGKIVVAPICGEQNAELLFTCKRAGCDATETKEEIAPANHKWEWKEDNKAGCTVTPGYVCAYCDAKHDTEPYSYTEHDYEDYNDPTDKEHKNVAATCEDGLKWEKCSECGDFKSTVLKADEYGYHTHPDDAGTDVTSMLTKISVHTCGNPGFMKCSKCGRDDIADKYDPAAHNYITVEPTCVDYGYKSCVICGHTVGYLYIDANGNKIINEEFDKLGHIVPDTGIEEHKAECDQRGWRKYVCQRPGCTGYDHMNVGTPAERKDGYVYEYTTAAALGHDWTAVPVVPAKCGVDGTTAHTLCERCGDTQNKTTIHALTHAYVTASIPANCLYPAHTGEVCKYCGIENMDPDVMSNWRGEKDETAHKWDESQTEMVTEATCTTPGLIRKYCTICNKPHEVTVKETGHTLVKIGTVPATCKRDAEVTPGYEVYFCTQPKCQAFQKGAAVTTIPTAELDQYGTHAKYTGDMNKDFTYDVVTGEFTLTPASHTWDTSTFVKFVGPDINDKTLPLIEFCGKYSYEERICSECGITYHNRLADSTTGLLTGKHHPVSADSAATCTTPGYIGRTVCQRCTTVITPGEIIPAKHTFDTKAADYQGFKAADCFAGGWDEKGTCTVCQQSGVMNGETAPLDHKVEGEFSLKLVEKRAADCVLFGYDAHYACTLCGAALLNAKVVKDADGNLDTTNVTIADFVTDLSVNGDNGYVAPLKHDWSGTVLFVPFACCEDGYAWKVCARQGCSEIQIQAYTFGYANHRYSDKTYSTDRDACEDSYNLCQNEVQKTAAGAVVKTYTSALVKCLNKDPLSVAAEPHKNAAGETIDLSDCKNWKDDQDHKCASCEVTFTIADVNHHGEAVAETIEATCISYEYELTSCTRCNHVWTKMLNAEYGNHPKSAIITDYVAPTWTTDGSNTEVCSLCGWKGKTEVIAAPDMFFDMSIDNIYDMKDEFGGNYTWDAAKQYYKKTNKMTVSKLANSSFVAVTIYATGSATNFTSINMSIPFDPKAPEALQFSPEMTEKNNGTLVIDGKSFVVDFNGTDDSVELFIHVENDKDGVPQNAVLTDRTALITLYFQVNPDFYDVAVKDTISEAISLEFGEISVLEYDAKKGAPKQLEDIVVDTKAPVAGYPEVNGGAYVLTVYKLGDLNLNGTVTDFDAILAEEMAFANAFDPSNATYNAQADIDKDGDVDLVDFMYIKQYVIEKITYAELAAKVDVATDAE